LGEKQEERERRLSFLTEVEKRMRRERMKKKD
jgi:hypothetical protein